MANPNITKGNFAIRLTQGSTAYKGPYSAKSIKQINESLADESSGRTDDGVMHINWVKSVLRKWEIELPPCDADTISEIFNIVQGNCYYIRIFDLTTKQVQEVKVYTSSTESDCYSGVLHGGLYQGVSFSAIELGE